MDQKFKSFVIRGEDTEIAEKIDAILNKMANSREYSVQHWTIAPCITGSSCGGFGNTWCSMILTICCNKTKD